MLDSVWRDLLMELQYNFPLCRRPFYEIARRLGLDEEQVIERVRNLQEGGVIKRIGAVLNYQSRSLRAALVALSVCDRFVEDLSAFLRQELGISHNYLRSHSKFNVWFVIKRRSFREIVDAVRDLSRRYGVKDYVVLGTAKTFRLDVKFNLYRGISEAKILRIPDSIPQLESVSKLSREILGMLYSIKVCSEPFEEICRRFNIRVEYLVNEVSRLVSLGVLRDFYAVLNQQSVGFRYNAVIYVPDACREDIIMLREPTHIVYREVIDGTTDYGRGCYMVVHAVSRDLIDDFVRNLYRHYRSHYIDVIYSVRDLLGTVRHDIEYL